MARARLASAEQQVLEGNWPAALNSAQTALVGIDQGEPDWLRAQDIVYQARA